MTPYKEPRGDNSTDGIGPQNLWHQKTPTKTVLQSRKVQGIGYKKHACIQITKE